MFEHLKPNTESVSRKSQSKMPVLSEFPKFTTNKKTALSYQNLGNSNNREKNIVVNRKGNLQLFQSEKSQRTITPFDSSNFDILQQTIYPVQTMKWPNKAKDQTSILRIADGSLWEGSESHEIKELYEWSDDREMFEAILYSIAYLKWKEFVNKSEMTGEKFREELNGLVTQENIISFFEFFKKKNEKVIPWIRYEDKLVYKFPSDQLGSAVKKLVTEDGIDINFERASVKLELADLEIADKELVKSEWEFQENKSNPDGDRVQNAKLRFKEAQKSASGALDNYIKETKNAIFDEEKLAKKKADVDSVNIFANTLKSFAPVVGNVLAKKIWDTTLNNAGKDGFVHVDEVVYKNVDVTTATGLLKTFSKEWSENKSGGKPTVMDNPHTPGGGVPNEKKTHLDVRKSKFQADFITIWWGVKLVVHINSDT